MRQSYLTYITALLLAVLPVERGLAGEDRWLHVESGHFEMISEVPEKQSRLLLIELEQFRIFFQTLMNPARAHEPRTTIVVFRDDGAFRPYQPLYKGKPRTDVLGYCLYSPDGICIAMNGSERHLPRAFDVIFHEYTHALVMQKCPRIPLWINEGLAKVFETFSVRGDHVTFGAGDPNAATMFRSLPPIGMARFLAVDHGSRYYNEGMHSGMFYSQAWAITHYLLCATEGVGKKGFDLAKLLQLLENPEVPDAEAVLQGTGLSPDELLHRVIQYSRDGRFRPLSLTVPAAPIKALLKVRPATPPEVELALLNLKWRTREAADTELRLLEITERHPDAPRPHELLAGLYANEGRPADAARHWRRAAELGSENAFVYVALARPEIRATRLAPGYRFPENLCVELRGWLDRAVELDPDYMDAYALLAMVEAFSPEIRERVIRRIKENAPDMTEKAARARLLLAGAAMLWRNGQYENSLVHIRAMQALLDERTRADGVRETMPDLRETARLFETRIRRDMDMAAQASAGTEAKPKGASSKPLN